MVTTSQYSLEVIRYLIPSTEHTHFEKAYLLASKYLQESEYCLGYEVLKGTEEPENYILHIRWTSMQDHLNGFRKSTSFPPFFQLVKPFFNHILEMKYYGVTKNSWSRS